MAETTHLWVHCFYNGLDRVIHQPTAHFVLFVPDDKLAETWETIKEFTISGSLGHVSKKCENKMENGRWEGYTAIVVHVNQADEERVKEVLDENILYDPSIHYDGYYLKVKSDENTELS